MGKHTQVRQTNSISISHDKTSQSFKWARMFNVLDYHRWHYVKKVIAHKKHPEGRDFSENEPKALVCEKDQCSLTTIVENSQFEAEKTDLSFSTKALSIPSSPRCKSSHSVPLSPTKSSRAAKIRKMIAKEVMKRRGRHRRSSTCPAGSELGQTDLGDQHLENTNEGLHIESIQAQSDKTCGLCNTMNIECLLGDRKLVGKQGEGKIDQLNALLQDISEEDMHELSLMRKTNRSVSFNHTKEFLDVLDVLNVNKEFFLRVLEDPGSSVKEKSLAKRVTTRSSKTKSLTKSGTFPKNDSLNTKESSFSGLFRTKSKSYTREDNSQQFRSENLSNNHSGQIIGRRFKDLRQKIRHLIKENRKERRRIAMDALLHKVPYGQRVSDERAKETPYVNVICDHDSSVSPNEHKDRKTHKRRSSFDESLDKYCQLFETTTSSKEPRMNIHDRSKLRVMDENSYRSNQKGLGRILSSPDLQVFLSNQFEDYDGPISSRTPNRKIMSFSERKVKYVLNIEGEDKRLTNTTKEATCKALEEYGDVSDTEALSSINDDEENVAIANGDPSIEPTQALKVDTYENDGDTISAQPMVLIHGSQSQMDSIELEGTLLEDYDPPQSQEFNNKSPTFSCLKLVENEVNSPIHYLSPNHRLLRVNSYEQAEFNYVRDILQLSEYSGTKVLGTWYSYDQPVNPSVFVELETCSLLEPEMTSYIEDNHSNHLLLFDMINETLLAIYERSVSYWGTHLSSCSGTHPMPKGHHVLEEVWKCIRWHICCSRRELDTSLDYITARDLAKYDGWMNLQFDAECVGLEIENLLFEDLLNELIN